MESCKNCKYMEFIYHPNGEIDETKHYCEKHGIMTEDKPSEEHIKVNYKI